MKRGVHEKSSGVVSPPSSKVDEETKINKRRKAQENGPDPHKTKENNSIVGPILYEPDVPLPKLHTSDGMVLEVHVLSQYLTKENPRLNIVHHAPTRPHRNTRLWLPLKYSAESDIVAILHHCGKYVMHDSIPNDRFGVRAQMRISVSDEDSSGLTSQPSKTVCLTVEHVYIMDKPNPTTELLISKRDQRKKRRGNRLGANRKKNILDEQDQFGFQGVLFPSTIILYNLSQEPCLKYDFNLICDRGVNCTQWTSFKLKSTVLFLENFYYRFELSREEFPLTSGFDAYRWAKVLKPFHLTRDLLSKVNVPLPNEFIDIIHQNLDFSDIRWGYDSVVIKGNEYKICKMFCESERNSPALLNEDSPNAMALLNSSPSCDSSSTTVLPVTPAPLNETTNEANNHFEKPNPDITNIPIQQIPTF